METAQIRDLTLPSFPPPHHLLPSPLRPPPSFLFHHINLPLPAPSPSSCHPFVLLPPAITHTHTQVYRYTSLKKACSFSPGHQPNPQTHEGQRRPFTEQNAARGGGDKDSCGGNILLLFVLHNANRAASPCWRTDQEDVRSGGCEQRFL